ncbi:MAG: substrate-binding domain-containing protein [Acidobacteria bacterium]|nr:substrate-binding domain-containing protein [Acidobacteriota bacterium]
MRWTILLSLAALVAAVCGCNREQKVRIGVVPKGTNHIYWQTVHAGSLKAAQEFGASIDWNAPALETDSSRQIEIVDAMINKQVAGLVLAPIDRKALVKPVERAAMASIPVAIFDSGIDTNKRVSYVATDNREGGRMAARRLYEVLGGKGKVGVIGFMPGSGATMDREQGFIDEIAKYPGMQMVGMQFGMADRARALAGAENMMTAHKDLAGLFADNESSSDGAVQALKQRNAKHIKLVAFDATEKLVRDLEEGWIDALVVQNPFKMGYEATKAVLTKLRGGIPPAVVDSGATLVKASDLKRPETKELLFPDIKQYLDLNSNAVAH